MRAGTVSKRTLLFAAGAAGVCMAAGACYAIGAWSVEDKFDIRYSLDKRENDQAIIDVIDGARRFVYFAVYTFTKGNIADALVAAKNRGLDVRGITDATEATSQYEKPVLAKLAAAGIPVETQQHPDGIMHIKAVVTDRAYALGSYNWTSSATVANDELLEIGTDDALRRRYLAIIEKVLADNAGPSVAPAASSAPVAIGYAAASSHIGENAAVSGTPLDVYVSGSGTVFFDYCADYKDCPFSAVIFADDAAKFGNLARYQGVPLTVTGVLTSYGGKAEMVLSDPGQIRAN